MALKKFDEFVSEINNNGNNVTNNENKVDNTENNVENNENNVPTNENNDNNVENNENKVNEGVDNAVLIAVNNDTQEEFEIANYEESRGWMNVPNGVEACIYVMPDDTVEIRSIDVEPYCLYGVFTTLTGEMVRENKLHRNEWMLITRK